MSEIVFALFVIAFLCWRIALSWFSLQKLSRKEEELNAFNKILSGELEKKTTHPTRWGII